MEKKIENALSALIEEGKGFNYTNFSTKSENGYPKAYKQEYISWKIKVEELIVRVFGKQSSIYENYKKHENYRVLRNGPQEFEPAHAYILGTLEAGLQLHEIEPESLEGGEANLDNKNKKVFVVHGHDEMLKNQVEIFLREIGLEPIVLHRQADEGLTIIEKFEKHSDVGYAFILLTPDDIGYSVLEENKNESERKKEYRARQNVIFELGYFIGRLSRNRVCCLYKSGVTIPTDISGVVYKSINNNVEEQAYSIIKELNVVGYSVTL